MEWTPGGVRAYVRHPPKQALQLSKPDVAREVETVVRSALDGMVLPAPASKEAYDASLLVGAASGDEWVLHRIHAVLVEALVEAGLNRSPDDLVAVFGAPIVRSLRRDERGLSVSFLDYVGLGLREEHAFACQEVENGRIHLGFEQVRVLVAKHLLRLEHLEADTALKDLLPPGLGRASRLVLRPARRRSNQHTDMAQHGLQPEHYPPCIRDYLDRMNAGQSLDHYRRFNLVAFLHFYGATEEELVDLFRNGPGFDEGVTRYQIQHIAGARTGTAKTQRGYATMSCAKMRDYGICPDLECPGRTPINQYYYTLRDLGRAEGAGPGTPSLPATRRPGRPRGREARVK